MKSAIINRNKIVIFTSEEQRIIDVDTRWRKSAKISELCLTSRGSGVRIPQLPRIIERFSHSQEWFLFLQNGVRTRSQKTFAEIKIFANEFFGNSSLLTEPHGKNERCETKRSIAKLIHQLPLMNIKRLRAFAISFLFPFRKMVNGMFSKRG